MKILFYLSAYPSLGGIENVTTLIVEHLTSMGHAVDIISHIQRPNCQKINPSVRLFKMPDKGKFYTSANCSFACDLLSREKYDIVIYQDSYAPTHDIVLKACHQSKIPLIVFEHSNPNFVKLKRTLTPWYKSVKSILRNLMHPLLLKRDIARKRDLLHNCKKYVLLSKNFIPEFINLVGCEQHREKIDYIYNPMKPLTAEPDFSKKKKELLFVGRLCVEKQVNKIIEVWEAAHPFLPDWELVIVGDGPERKRLEKQAKKLPRLRFAGVQMPVTQYDESSVFLMTSKIEGWGLTVVEAMQHGVIPLAENNYASIPEIIDDGKNGFILSKNAPIKEWVEILTQIAGGEVDLKRMREHAITKAQNFEIQNIIGKWETLLNDVVEK